jgi:hypothetical protein
MAMYWTFGISSCHFHERRIESIYHEEEFPFCGAHADWVNKSGEETGTADEEPVIPGFSFRFKMVFGSFKHCHGEEGNSYCSIAIPRDLSA